MKKLALILLLIIFPFGQLLRFEVGNGIVLHINDLAIGVIGSMGIIRGISMREKDNLKKPMFFWVLAMGVSLILNFQNYSFSQLVISSLYLFRWIAYAGLYFFFKDCKFSKNYLVLAALGVALVGIIQYLLIPDVSFLAASNWDNHYFRLVSTFLDPGFTGMILVLALLLKPSAIIYTAMLLTYSRASYLAFLISMAFLYKKSLRIFLGICVIFLISVSLLPKSLGEGTKLARSESTFARIESWKQAIDVWKTAPIFGVGFNTYRYATKNNDFTHAGGGSDSSILTVLATTGILGCLGYLGLLSSLWKKGKLLFKTSLLAVFIHSWFNNTLFYPWVMEWLWLLLVFDS